MTHVVLQKVRGALVAADEQSQAFLDKLKAGEGVSFDVRIRRNARFHRKAMALIRLTFDAWQEAHPDEQHSKTVAFERFREWLLILAGHYEEFAYPDGSVQVRAKSMAFDRCDELEFNDLYARLLNVAWDRVLRLARYGTEQDVEMVVNRLLNFS